MLTILVSGRQAGKSPAENAVYAIIEDEYKAADFAEKTKMIVISPKQGNAAVEDNVIKAVGGGGIFGMRVMSADRFIEEGTAHVSRVDAHGRLMLVQRSLQKLRGELSYFRNTSAASGAAAPIAEEIRLLKDAGLRPADLAGAEIGGQSGLRLSDMAKIYRDYEQAVSGYRGGDEYTRLEEICEKAYKEMKGWRFYIPAGEMSFEPRLAALMQALAHHNEVIMGITAPSADPSAVAGLIPGIAGLIDDTRKAGTFRGMTEVKSAPAKTPLEGIGAAFTGEPLPEGDLPVSAHSARNPRSEIHRTAQLIAKEVAGGRKYSDIAVLMADPSYRNDIAHIFGLYGIPVYLDEKVKLEENPVSRVILSAIKAASGDARAFISYAQSGLAPVSDQEAGLLAAFYSEAGVRDARSPFGYLPYSWGMTCGNPPALKRIQECLMDSLSPLASPGRSFGAKAQAVKDFLEKIKAEDRVEDMAIDLEVRGEKERATAMRQSLEAALTAVDQIQTILGTAKGPADAFSEILAAGLESYSVGVVPENADAVEVSALERAYLTGKASVYLTGADDTSLPKRAPERGILTKRDKELLGESTGKRLTEKDEYLAGADMDFYKAVTSASESFTALWPETDMEGNAQIPSRYLTRLAQVAGRNLTGGEPGILDVLTKANAAAVLESVSGGRERAEVASALAEFFKDSEEGYGAVMAGAKDSPEKESPALSDLLRRRGSSVGVTEIQNAARCLMRHTLGDVLGIRAPGKPKVAKDTVGTFLHSYMEGFFREAEESAGGGGETLKAYLLGLGADTEALAEEADRIFLKTLEESPERDRFEKDATSRWVLRKIQALCHTLAAVLVYQLENSDFIPSDYEKGFSIPVPTGWITGKIDRVDRDPGTGKVRVIDYKSGARKMEWWDIYAGAAIQLAVYLEEQQEREGADAAGGLFFTAAPPKISLDAGFDDVVKAYKMKGFYDAATKSSQSPNSIQVSGQAVPGPMTREELTALLGGVKKTAAGLHAEIMAGMTEARPLSVGGERTGCAWCPYRIICRFDENNPAFSQKEVPKIGKKEYFESIETL